ncbi:MAG: hypothetical protein ABIH85_04615 [Candidatus Omnitrophota bacterium]|nr:hypothetical protein [Candidatus Omnitrophota bacterium]MBU1894301.1 hypothetical protein [Candidatus Omnitrophota bacterium]
MAWMYDIFIGWTKGLSAKESRIAVFEKIRKIPFVVVPELFRSKNNVMDILKKNEGFCISKQYVLAAMFQKLQLDVKYYICSFRWKDLNVEFPVRLKNFAEQVPVTYHFACKVFLNEKWVFVDATWDSELKKVNFPVNEKWDGEKSTRNAVNPIEEFTFDSIAEQDLFFSEKIMQYSFSDKLKLSKFSKMLNTWLGEARHATKQEGL